SRGEAPKAAFEFQTSGLKAVFVDQSTGSPTSWTWDFGDCSGGAQCRSTEQNPSYTYKEPGTYTVNLTATNDAGSNRVSKLVQVSTSTPPVASFCYRRSGLSVIFNDTSTQSPTAWSWNFGDCGTSPGTCTSTSQNPAHTYASDATYAVTLTVTNAAGQRSVSRFVPVAAAITDGGLSCN
ncbi:MAG TPA: PKD domain-containing protein, partial [Thermoanaerobaculia bacterium]|nr:PKD domain-containing protein [Thermoanaerobaculia bacterium]